MSFINYTSPSSPDPLEAILHRLNGTVIKVSKLRLFLGDLETELTEIRRKCENAISTGALITSSADKPHIVVDRGRAATGHHPPSIHRARLSPSPSSVPGSRKDIEPVKQNRNPNKQGGQTVVRHLESSISRPKRDLESSQGVISRRSESKSPIPSSASSRISGGSGLSSRDVVKAGNSLTSKPVSRSRFGTPAQTQVQHGGTPVSALRPPIKGIVPKQIPLQPRPKPVPPLSPFPKDTDLSSYPSELKREGDNWSILFNPLPKVQRVLDVNLVCTLSFMDLIHCVKFSPDARWLATCCHRIVQIYNVEKGAIACVLGHPEDVRVWCASFSPDGNYLATGASDRVVRVWDIAQSQIHDILKGHQDAIYSVLFSPNGQFIVSGSWDGTVRIWDINDKTAKILSIDQDQYLPQGRHHGVTSLALSPDGRYVAVGSANTVVSIWEVATGVQVQLLREHRDRIRCLAFMPDGKGLISGEFHMLKFWDISRLDIGSSAAKALARTFRTSPAPCLMNFTVHNGSVCHTAVSHDGAWVVSGLEDGRVVCWEARTGMVQFMLSGHQESVIQVDMSPTGNLLATGDWNGEVRIWRCGVRNT